MRIDEVRLICHDQSLELPIICNQKLLRNVVFLNSPRIENFRNFGPKFFFILSKLRRKILSQELDLIRINS